MGAVGDLLMLVCLALQATEAGLREVCRSVRIGKILIQRVRLFLFISSSSSHARRCSRGSRDPSNQDEETAQAKLFYSKVRPSARSMYGAAANINYWDSSRQILRSDTSSFSTPCLVRRSACMPESRAGGLTERSHISDRGVGN